MLKLLDGVKWYKPRSRCHSWVSYANVLADGKLNEWLIETQTPLEVEYRLQVERTSSLSVCVCLFVFVRVCVCLSCSLAAVKPLQTLHSIHCMRIINHSQQHMPLKIVHTNVSNSIVQRLTFQLLNVLTSIVLTFNVWELSNGLTMS